MPTQAQSPQTPLSPHYAGAAEAVWLALAPLLPGLTVEVLAEVDSTNSELMRRARAGCCAPQLLLAVHQTAGRGRLGRLWLSPPPPPLPQAQPAALEAVRAPGQAAPAALPALTFSLGWPLAAPVAAGLSLAVGVSLAQSLHPQVQLKWPNDLWLQGRKLGGILVETTRAGGVHYAVVGVGINLLPLPGQGLATPPAWLTELLPHIDAPQTLLRCALPLVQSLELFERAGFAAFHAAFTARDALANMQVDLSDGRSGRALGVDETGALRLQTEQGRQTLHSADVSVRPAHAASLGA